MGKKCDQTGTESVKEEGELSDGETEESRDSPLSVLGRRKRPRNSQTHSGSRGPGPNDNGRRGGQKYSGSHTHSMHGHASGSGRLSERCKNVDRSLSLRTTSTYASHNHGNHHSRPLPPPSSVDSYGYHPKCSVYNTTLGTHLKNLASMKTKSTKTLKGHAERFVPPRFRGGRRSLHLNVNGKNESAADYGTEPPPPGIMQPDLCVSPEVSDYDSLLQQYQIIKKRLDNLQREEDKVSEVLSDAAPAEDYGKDRTETAGEGDEDLNILELRLAALASAARASVRGLENEAPAEPVESATPKRMPKKIERKKSSSRSPKGSRNRSRYTISRNVTKMKESVEIERTRRECRKILTMDDPNEQFRQFLLFARKHAGPLSGSMSKETSDVLEDNYEPVEMELDSDVSSTDIQINKPEPAYYPEMPDTSMSFMEPVPMYQPSFFDPVYTPGQLATSHSTNTMPEMPSYIPPPPQSIPLPPSPVPEQPPMPPEEDMPSPPPPPPPLEAPPLPPSSVPLPSSEVVYIPTPITKENIPNMKETNPLLDEPYSPGSPSPDFAGVMESVLETETRNCDAIVKDNIDVFTNVQDVREDGKDEEGAEVADIVERATKEAPQAIRERMRSDGSVEDDEEEGEIREDVQSEDEDLDCLRAKLLETVASRRREKLQQQEARLSRESSQSPPVTSVNARKVVLTSQTRRNQPVNMTHLPEHDRVVVHLSDEGSEKEEETLPKVLSSNNFSLGLDQFLKEVRQSVETAKEKPKEASKPQTKVPVVYRSVQRKQPSTTSKESSGQDKVARNGSIQITVKNDPLDVSGEQSPSAMVSYESQSESAPEFDQSMLGPELGDMDMAEDIENQVPASNAHEMLDAKFQQYEKELVKQRTTVKLEETRQRALASQIGKKKTTLLAAEKKVRKLREHLMATERLVLKGREEIYNLSLESSALATTVKERKENIAKLEDELSELGTHLYGEDHKLKDLSPTPSKRKPASSQSGGPAAKKARPLPNVAAAGGPPAAAAAAAAKKKKMDLARELERKRLQEMKDQLAEMIRQFKEQAKAKEEGEKEEDEKVEVPQPREEDVFNVLKNKDKILLESDEYVKKKDVDAVNIDEFRVRRKSLLNLNQSFKPDLETSLTHDDARQSDRLANLPESAVVGGDVVTSTPRSSDGKRSRTATPDPTAKPLLVKKLSKRKRMQLQKLMVKNVQPLLHHSGPYEAIPKFLPPISQMAGIKFETGSKDSSKLSSYKTASYKSALLCLRGYRLNKFFRTKEGIPLTSPMITNKINPEKMICRFSLDGVCNDEKCCWQHAPDYQMDLKEILQDIVSYCPKLAGVTDDTPPELYSKFICDYVDNFIKQNEGKTISQDDMCLLLISRVNGQMGKKHPYCTPLEGRVWRPTQAENPEEDPDDEETRPDTELKPVESTAKEGAQHQLSFSDLDNIINENDVRYFMVGSEGIQDLEAEVLKDKENTFLWIKLAYKKLYAENENESPANCLDQGLNVLARALEQNKSSPELWQHYLSLYRRREDVADLKDLYQHALCYAPSYRIWWEYLNLCDSCDEKRDVCLKIVDFLISSDLPYDKHDERSYQLLEIVLYHVALMTQSGKLKTGQQILQSALKVNIVDYLQPKDRCIGWLAYIYLLEFHHLPPKLFDPVDSNPGKIVSREPFLIPWQTVQKLRSSPEQLSEIFEEALASCQNDNPYNLTQCVLPLERNYANLLAYLGRMVEAKQRFEDLTQLEREPKNEDVWYAYAAMVKDTENGVTLAKEVLFQSLLEKPCSAKLNFTFAQLAYTEGYREQVVGLLVSCISENFEIDKTQAVTYDPIMLYKKCLGLSVPYNLPPFIENLDPATLKESAVYIWLNFCFLMALQGDEAQTIDLYETAISTLTDLKDIQTVWLCYLRYRLSCVESSPADTKQKVFKNFTELVYRCLSSMPSRFPVPYRPDQTWIDYTYHNEVIDLYVGLLEEENVFKAYEKFTQMMPNNCGLITRYLKQLMASGHHTQAKLLACSSVLYNNCRNLGLTKCAASLIKRKHELRKFFKKATGLLPYAITLWKDYILFEVVNGNEAAVGEILKTCRARNVNIDNYLNAIVM